MTVIAVGGIDGSGKTTFARELQARCREHGVEALLLHVDDFRRPVDWEVIGRDEAAIYLEDYFDFAAIEACIEAFRAGRERASRPLFDEVRNVTAGHAEVPLVGVDVVIIEGVFAHRLACASSTFRVHLMTSFGEARRRIIARRSPPWRTVEEFDYRIGQRYFPAQQRYLTEVMPEQRASVLLDNEDTERPRLVRAELEALPPRVRGALADLLLSRTLERRRASTG
jgi:uridine kinase